MLLGIAPAGQALAPCVTAEVVEKAPGGFTVRHERELALPADRAYEILLDVRSWWNPAHTYSGDARNLSIEAQDDRTSVEGPPGTAPVRAAVGEAEGWRASSRPARTGIGSPSGPSSGTSISC